MRRSVTDGGSVLQVPGDNARAQRQPDGQDGAVPGISVIVPVRNGNAHLARCLEALSRSEYANFEVIVVDDCSTDNTPQIAEQYGARCLHTPRTLGPGGARNLGAQHSRAARSWCLWMRCSCCPADAVASDRRGFCARP